MQLDFITTQVKESNDVLAKLNKHEILLQEVIKERKFMCVSNQFSMATAGD